MTEIYALEINPVTENERDQKINEIEVNYI